MFLEAAIGDAYGAGFEYADPAVVRAENDPRKGYRQHRVPKGCYTDDTQMAIALAFVMLKSDWRDVTATDLANQFMAQFRADPRIGYSGKFQEILTEITALMTKFGKNLGGPEFLRRIRPNSAKSGGAMRAWPCGLLPTLEDAIDFSMFQASLTHATREGMDAAAAVATLVWCCRQGYDGDMISETLDARVPGYAWEIPWKGPVGSSGIAAVKAAVTAVNYSASMVEILRESVAFTGDVDTVACIALAAASVHPDIINDLPKILYQGLEKGKYGLQFLKDLDSRMLKQFPLIVPQFDVSSLEHDLPVDLNPCGEIPLEDIKPDPNYKSPTLEKLRGQRGILDLLKPDVEDDYGD